MDIDKLQLTAARAFRDSATGKDIAPGDTLTADWRRAHELRINGLIEEPLDDAGNPILPQLTGRAAPLRPLSLVDAYRRPDTATDAEKAALAAENTALKARLEAETARAKDAEEKAAAAIQALSLIHI